MSKGKLIVGKTYYCPDCQDFMEASGNIEHCENCGDSYCPEHEDSSHQPYSDVWFCKTCIDETEEA